MQWYEIEYQDAVWDKFDRRYVFKPSPSILKIKIRC